jgi:ATP-dependent helicase HrpA
MPLPDLTNIEVLMPGAMRRDRLAVRKVLRRIRKKDFSSTSPGVYAEKVLALEKRLRTSVAKKMMRIEGSPSPTFNPDLPITEKKDEIITAINNHQVVIVAGETGSGKTTQIPKFCLAAGRGIEGRIGCTQPRRIAATTVAKRIAEELGSEMGLDVGYKIRFSDHIGPDTYIKIMTDGILLAETQADPYLNQYDTIILDEAHERSLNIDFILGFLRSLLKKRRDLKLIITSATIDTEKFSRAFDNAPVVTVSGRMFPVEERYLPPGEIAVENGEATYVEAAARAVDILQHEDRFGDILVFMPTEQDIRETAILLKGRHYSGVTVLTLFARLPASEQTRVFSRISGRKIIIATNVAETSITIPGIRYVVDTGLARISRYRPRSRTTALPIVPISRSSAEQRKGRCGRMENGVCIRLYSQDDFMGRPLYTAPEIMRTSLADVILRMISLKLGHISDFSFIDRPAEKNIRDGFDLLLELGAIVENNKSGSGQREWGHGASPLKKRTSGKKRASGFGLTSRGRVMARMPVDPRLSRVLIEADARECLHEIVTIVAALSIRDPRERPTEKAAAADQAHAAFADPASDLVALLNLWNRYQEALKQEKSTGRMKQFCRRYFLSFPRMREWRDIRRQLCVILKECGFNVSSPGKTSLMEPGKPSKNERFHPLYVAIHKSILSGFLTNIAMKKEKNIFSAARGRETMIFPGSGLFNKAASWIVAAEMVETSRLFSRVVANIDSDWLEEAGGNLCKRIYLEPHWERKRGEVVALEQVTLFGLILVTGRPVSYGRIDPEKARDIFIRSALVEGDLRQPLGFMDHNMAHIEAIRDMENRIRRRDILVSEEELFQFYCQRLENVYDIRTLKHLIRRRKDDAFLRITEADLMRYRPDADALSRFPDTIDLDGLAVACGYKFDPGHEGDGVTITVPSALVSAVSPDKVQWLVPGLFREKVEALIKGLAKTHRKRLVPVTDTVDEIVNTMPRGEGPLVTQLGQFIFKRFGVDIPASAWRDDLLPEHLRARISVVDASGTVLRSSRDLAVLFEHHATSAVPEAEALLRKKWERENIKQWDFGTLPHVIPLEGKDHGRWNLYPGLVVAEKIINLRLSRDCHRSEALHKEGVQKLFSQYFAKELRFLKRQLVLSPGMVKKALCLGGAKAFEATVYKAVVDDLFFKNIRSEDSFAAHAESIWPVMVKRGSALMERGVGVLEVFYSAVTTLAKIEASKGRNPVAGNFCRGLRSDLNKLVPENFMEIYNTEQLDNLVRYVRAITIRTERAFVDFEKDRVKAIAVEKFSDSLKQLLGELTQETSAEKRKAVEALFWMIEELKVSLFAQEIKTAFPISEKRLRLKLEEVGRMV